MAWARLGVIFLSAAEHDKTVEYLTKAYHLSKNVSEHERLYIEAHYYRYGLGDLPKAIATLKLATQTYPRNMENYVNLGNAQEAYGELEQISSPSPRQ
jgi:tetratricopeptide (TPR) repeat protein